MMKMRTKTRTDLVDVFTPLGARVWYRLRAEGPWDLSPEECSVVVYGSCPGWYNQEDELADQIGLEHGSNTYEVGGYAYHYPWRGWAIEQGIAPGQPFLLAIDKPNFHRSYEGEYDVDWFIEVVDVVYWSPQRVLQSWEHDFRRLARAQYLAFEDRQLELKQLERNTAAMYIQHRYYGYGAYSFEPAKGIDLTIQAEPDFGHFYSCGNGRDDTGDEAKAMEQLIQSACERNPHLSPEIIRGMRHRKT